MAMARKTWNNPQTGERAQFVADVLNEALFDYSFDSNKVPSLNIHSFCEDYISTYQLVEEGGMQSGNMVPLDEEMENILSNSIWLPKGISESLLLFKNNKGKTIDIRKDATQKEEKTKYYYKNAKYISSFLESDDNYICLLMNKIEEILRGQSFDYQEKRELYFCLREYLAELIGLSISKGYLFNRVQVKLFNASAKSPSDDIKYILSFLSSLTPPLTDYSVVFGMTKDAYMELNNLVKGLREATETEEKQLGTKYVAEKSFKACDPYSALEIAKGTFSSILCVYNSCIHNVNIKVVSKGLVKKKDAKNWSLINDSKNLLEKNRNKTFDDRKEWLNTAVKRGITPSLFSAFELHNNALITEDAQTQLLTLWTIFEILIGARQSFMSRANYISNVVCSVLCNMYYDRRLSELYRQISQTKGVSTLIDQEPRGDTRVKKLAFILKDNSTLKQSIIHQLQAFPLGVYKIEELSAILSSKENMKCDIIRHEQRLKWQIMRIYRNRCSITHGASSFSYIDSIVENQHYYVDEILNYIFIRRKQGIIDLDAAFTHARIVGHNNMKLLDSKDVLSDDQYERILFDY